ncbi:MAG: hypothetical protein CMH25_03810 [Micavibrio sp.]|nr:hypothetical protein [Micavibrio sp.]
MSHFFFKRLFVLLIVLLVTGCASAPSKKTVPTTPRPLACHAGEIVFVNIRGPEKAELQMNGRLYYLGRKSVSKGVLYKDADNDIIVHNHGLNYTIVNGREQFLCRPLPTLSRAN